MLTTRFTEMVGCSVPIQQAGMGQLANPELAGAVANAGGLGLVSVRGMSPERIARFLDEARHRSGGASGGAIGANVLFMDDEDPEEVRGWARAAAPHARVVDFFWGTPDSALVEIVHAGGALACWQVGSVDAAAAADRAGCDFVVAQGTEAGGHVQGHIGLLALLDQVLAAVSVPVVAAGGIGSGRAMAAALAAGAAGVRVGTRFVAAEEAHAHPTYVQALIAARPEDSVYTEAFSYGWEHAPHRVLRSSVEAAEAYQGEIVGQRPDHDGGEPTDVHRFAPLAVTDQVTGTIEAMPLWAGESVGGVTRVQPAGDIVRELAGEAERFLRVF